MILSQIWAWILIEAFPLSIEHGKALIFGAVPKHLV